MYRSIDKELYDNISVGFLKPDDGSADVFVHYTNIVSDGFKSLEAQQKVEYEIGKNHAGPQAINVKAVD